MPQPKPLQQGNKIAIVSPAGIISAEKVDIGIVTLTSWGFDPIVDQNALNKSGRFAGTDSERLHSFQQALDDPEIKAILCSRGGYGMVRIIDQLDFSTFKNSPKWIIGYSDITILHCHIHTSCNIATLHATMPTNFATNTNETLESLKAALMGKALTTKTLSDSYNRQGNCEGILIGGNLSVLTSLVGTNSDIDTAGKILFIEDIDEDLYHLDRLLWTLKKAKKLDRLAGLIVGQFTSIRDVNPTFGKSLEEIILEKIKGYDYPVCFNFPVGHVNDNRTLIVGITAQLTISDTTVTLKQ